MIHVQRVLLAMAIGCGLAMAADPASAADVKVSGMVTVGGKPLAAGKVSFYLADGQFVGSKVKEGKYAVDRVPAGVRKVTVEGEGVPVQYSRDETSPLVVEVKDRDATFYFSFP